MRAAQFVEPAVSRAKFAREIEQYRAMEAEYRSRGWFLTSATFPIVEVVLAAPQLRPPALVTGVRFDYTNYDVEPPSVHLVNPFTGVPYIARELPVRLDRAVQGAEFPVPGLPGGLRFHAAQPLMQAHDDGDVPFLCLAGVREYHEHPAHSGDSWELHRQSGAGRLVRLLSLIYEYGVQAISGYSVQLVPQIGFESGGPPS